MPKNALNDPCLFDERDQPHAPTAAWTRQSVEAECPPHQLGPEERARSTRDGVRPVTVVRSQRFGHGHLAHVPDGAYSTTSERHPARGARTPR